MSTPAIKALDLKAISPASGDKFSPNLYKWLSSRSNPSRRLYQVYRAPDGVLWIGDVDGDWLTGCRLMGVLCNGIQEPSGAYAGLGARVTVIADFWARYEAIGRCAIDDTHERYFIGDETRWAVTGFSRSCLWCSNCTQITVKAGEETEWVNTPAQSSIHP